MCTYIHLIFGSISNYVELIGQSINQSSQRIINEAYIVAITLTENAAKHIQKQLDKRGKGIALRIGIKKSGCSGFSYKYDYADDIHENEKIFESCNTRIVVDAENLPYLDGSQIDFIKDGLNSAFKFSNPNTENSCGCGESVSFKGPVSV